MLKKGFLLGIVMFLAGIGTAFAHFGINYWSGDLVACFHLNS